MVTIHLSLFFLKICWEQTDVEQEFGSKAEDHPNWTNEKAQWTDCTAWRCPSTGKWEGRTIATLGGIGMPPSVRTKLAQLSLCGSQTTGETESSRNEAQAHKQATKGWIDSNRWRGGDAQQQLFGGDKYLLCLEYTQNFEDHDEDDNKDNNQYLIKSKQRSTRAGRGSVASLHTRQQIPMQIVSFMFFSIKFLSGEFFLVSRSSCCAPPSRTFSAISPYFEIRTIWSVIYPSDPLIPLFFHHGPRLFLHAQRLQSWFLSAW